MAQDPTITKQLIVEHGLTTDEYSALKSIIGRDPSFTELGIFRLCGRSTVHTKVQKNG